MMETGTRDDCLGDKMLVRRLARECEIVVNAEMDRHPDNRAQGDGKT